MAALPTALYLTDSKILYLLPCVLMFRKYSPEIFTPLLLFSRDHLSYLAMTEVAFHADITYYPFHPLTEEEKPTAGRKL